MSQTDEAVYTVRILAKHRLLVFHRPDDPAKSTVRWLNAAERDIARIRVYRVQKLPARVRTPLEVITQSRR